MGGRRPGPSTVMSNASWVMVTWLPPSVNRITDRRDWKHDLSATSLAGSKYKTWGWTGWEIINYKVRDPRFFAQLISPEDCKITLKLICVISAVSLIFNIFLSFLLGNTTMACFFFSSRSRLQKKISLLPSKKEHTSNQRSVMTSSFMTSWPILKSFTSNWNHVKNVCI